MSERLSVLAVTLRYPPYTAGGYELLTRDAVEGLRAAGHTVNVLAGRGERFEREAGVLPWLEPALDGHDDLFRHSWDANDAERFRLHFLRLANRRATLKALERTGADVLLFFNLGLVSLAPLVAARHAEVPTLGYIADPWPENHWVRDWRAREADPPWQLRLLERGWRAFRSLVDLGPLLVSSASLGEALARDGVPRGSLDVLPLGLPPDVAAAAADARPTPRASGEPLTVACTSMLWEGKGQHVLLEAAARCEAPLDVVVAGDGDPAYRRRLERARPDCARLVGRLERDEVAALLRSAHAFCLPSTWPEPFGLATLEALACGATAVVSDAGASPEIVRDGVDGKVVPAGDAAALARAFEALAADDDARLALAHAGRRRALEDFDHGAFLEGLERALVRAAGGRAA